MAEPHHQVRRGLTLPMVYGSLMLAVRVLQAGAILSTHTLAVGGQHHLPEQAGGLAEVAFWLLAFPPGIAGYLTTRRSSSGGFRVGVLTGAIGGLLLAVVDTVVRVALPGLWILLSYVGGPPPGPLVSPVALFAGDLGISLFWGLVAGSAGSGSAQFQLRHSDVTDADADAAHTSSG